MTAERNRPVDAQPGEAGSSTPTEAARAAARLSKALELALGEAGLSLPQYRLLAFLAGGPERATALAGWLDVRPPSLTALVDGAVARGLVERVTVEDDRRCVRHVITERGHETLAAGDAAAAARLEAVLEHLAPSEQATVAEGLRLLGKALDAARRARVATGEAHPAAPRAAG